MDSKTVMTTRQLRQAGYESSEIARLVTAGEIDRLRRGGYAVPDPERTPEDRHRLLIAAALPLLHADVVLSHGSAAVLHDLPVWTASLAQVHVIRSRPNGARTRAGVTIHGSPLAAADITEIERLPVTTLARTAADLARTTSFTEAVCVADRAITRIDRATLLAQVEQAHGWPGVRRARRVAEFADPLAESPLESVSRVKMAQAGLPDPQLQLEVHDRLGRLLGRADFAWPELRTLGEFDGKIKYGRLLRPGQTTQEAVYDEKLREDAFRDLGWQVVRWTAADLADFGSVADRLWRAFERGKLAPSAHTPRSALTHPVQGVFRGRRGA